MRLLLPVFATLLSLLTGCAYTAPFRRATTPPPPPEREVLIVLSEVEIAPGHRSAFFRDTRAVLDAMPAQTGLLGYSFRFEFLGRRAWTMTAWTDEAAMRRFVRSPAHLAAMQRAGTTTAATRFVRLRRPAAAVPLPWSEAIQLLAAAPASTDRTSPSSP